MTACQRWRYRQHSWRRTSEGGFNPDHYGRKAHGWGPVLPPGCELSYGPAEPVKGACGVATRPASPP